jgi:hypothetical protein
MAEDLGYLAEGQTFAQHGSSPSVTPLVRGAWASDGKGVLVAGDDGGDAGFAEGFVVRRTA